MRKGEPIRAIDADKLLSERMKSKYYHLPNGDIAIPIIDIENAPTIEPALPEVIRCKDCKNWDTTWHGNWAGDGYYCPNVDGVRESDFYCADAERRTDE